MENNVIKKNFKNLIFFIPVCDFRYLRNDRVELPVKYRLPFTYKEYPIEDSK